MFGMLLRVYGVACLVASCATEPSSPSYTLPLQTPLAAWSCPRAGTVVEWEDSRGKHGTNHFEGADTDNPEVCKWKNKAGVERRSWFLARDVEQEWLPDERTRFQEAMRALLNGQAQVVSFIDPGLFNAAGWAVLRPLCCIQGAK